MLDENDVINAAGACVIHRVKKTKKNVQKVFKMNGIQIITKIKLVWRVHDELIKHQLIKNNAGFLRGINNYRYH